MSNKYNCMMCAKFESCQTIAERELEINRMKNSPGINPFFCDKIDSKYEICEDFELLECQKHNNNNAFNAMFKGLQEGIAHANACPGNPILHIENITININRIFSKRKKENWK